MINSTRIATLALLMLQLSSPVAAADTAQEIVDRAIAFHGGELYRSTETSLTISSKSGTFSMTSRMDGGLFDHRVTRVRDGREELVRLTNDQVTLTVDGKTKVAEGETARRLTTFVNERIYFPFLPFRLDDPGVIHTDLGIDSWEGRPLHRIKVTFEGAADDGDEYVYWFDPETGRLEQFAYSFRNNDGGLRLRRAFNYRRVGGILFYDSHNYGLSGNEHRVEEITPAFVSSMMTRISTVTLKDIDVKPVR
jgi:hypothetical protein